MRIQNPVKPLTWSFLWQLFTAFSRNYFRKKSSILDVWQVSEYDSEKALFIEQRCYCR